MQLKVYADQECITVKYLDDENDDISISSQHELHEAFKVNTPTQSNSEINLAELLFKSP